MQHQFGIGGGTPVVVKNLIIINVLFLVGTNMLDATYNFDLYNLLSLHLPTAPDFKPHQLITHFFMHAQGSWWHLLFNMFALWLFGSRLEMVWGAKRFLIFYIITGVGASLLYLLTLYAELYPEISNMKGFLDTQNIDYLKALMSFHQFEVDEYYTPELYSRFEQFYLSYQQILNNPSNTLLLNDATTFISEYYDYFLNRRVMLGASGAVFGILAAYGMLFPNQVVYLYFLFPIKIKYLVIGLCIFELFAIIRSDPTNNVANFAHLAGALIGYLLVKFYMPKYR